MQNEYYRAGISCSIRFLSVVSVACFEVLTEGYVAQRLVGALTSLQLDVVEEQENARETECQRKIRHSYVKTIIALLQISLMTD